MRNFFKFLCLVSIFLFIDYSILIAGDIYEPSPLEIISFQEYVEINSALQGTILSREIKVKISNNNALELTNLKLKLDGLPEYVTAYAQELYFGSISSNSVVTSNESIKIDIDTSQIVDNQIEFIWQVIGDLNGEAFLDETSVVETINF